MADLYLTSTSHPAFTWGGASLDAEGTARQRYLDALIHALTTDDYEPSSSPEPESSAPLQLC
jgi:hypothetical protein